MKIKRIHIHQMPGFRNGLKPYTQLAPQVNIIAGRNGTGKSSTARVIQKLIWWEKENHLEVNAELSVNDQLHKIEIDSPDYIHIDPAGNKSAEDFSYVSPKELGRQYMLALHDLVVDNNQDLAQLIDRQIKGGLDLNQSIHTLDYPHINLNANNPAFAAYESANRLYQEKLRNQEKLRKEADTLDILRQQRKEAEEAATKASLYTLLNEYASTADGYAQTTKQLEGFSPILAHLRKEDYAEVEMYETKIATTTAHIRSLEQETAKLKVAISQLSLSADKVDETLIDQLEIYTEEAKQSEQRIVDVRIIIQQLLLKKAMAASAISLDEGSSVPEINLPAIRELEDLTNEANRVQAELDTFAARKEGTTKELAALRDSFPVANIHEELTRREEAVSALSKWLKAEIKTTGQSVMLPVLLASVSIASIFLAYYTWYGLIGIGVIVPIVIYILIKNNIKQKPAELLTREEDFIRTGLQTPSQWKSQEVTERLTSLLSELQTVKQIIACQEQLKSREYEWQLLTGRMAILDKKYREMAIAIGTVSPLTTDSSNKYNTFYYYICHLIDWQQATSALREQEEKKAELEKQLQEKMDGCNKLYTQLRLPQIATSTESLATIKQLRKEWAERERMLAAIENNDKLIGQETLAVDENKAALQRIYDRLTLTEDRKETIRELLDQLADYHIVRTRLQNLSYQKENLFAKLEIQPGWQPQLVDMPQPEIGNLLDDVNQKAAGKDELIKQISSIEGQIRQIRQQDEVEKSLYLKEQAFNQLECTFDQTMQAITGQLVTNGLKKEIAINNDNKVFQEANRLLGKITQGRYNLTITEENSIRFEAVDTITHKTLRLDQLSTGTRVQLLLAIRLAYIQTLESTIKLPILADELLANSDDERSIAIIEALIEISRDRQLFYFTAQGDEVAKWQSLLNRHKDIESSITLLGDDPLPYKRQENDQPKLTLYQPIPAPDKMDKAAYLKQLNVAPFDPMEQDVSELHCWYLIDDLNLLFQCLQRGLGHWGQLHSYLSKGGLLPSMQPDEKERIERKVRFISCYIDLYRTGRPRKIRMENIDESGAISIRFREDVLQLVKECNGNPVTLLESLSALKGFRKDKIEELRSYLTGNNYMDGKDSLTPQQLSEALLVEASRLHLDPEEADSLLNSLLFS